VIEDVKELDAYVERERFPNLRPLQKPEVGVVESGSMEEPVV
jgi:hypothetical protein